MSRAEELKAKQLDEAEWRKMYYKHQQQYIKKRLEAIKYLQTEEVSMYFTDLCKDAHVENIEKVSIILDNKSGNIR